MSTDKNDLLIDALREDLNRERAGNRRSTIIGGALVVLVGGYLAFLHSQVSPFFEPEELALFATGAAIEAAPEVEAQLRDLMVDSAPDIARTVSTAVVDAVPTYRQVLEAELKPVMDEASLVMAGAAVSTMLKSERSESAAERESLEAAADAVVDRLDRVFEQALHERADVNGPSPAELIEQSVDRLVVVDRGLRRLARGGGDAAERELVLTVLGVIDGVQKDRETAEKADYAAEQAAEARKANKGAGAANAATEGKTDAKATEAPTAKPAAKPGNASKNP